MQVVVTLRQARSGLSGLVDRALAGDDVVITQGGKPAVRLVPIRRERVPGLAKGKIAISADFDAPLPNHVARDFEPT